VSPPRAMHGEPDRPIMKQWSNPKFHYLHYLIRFGLLCL